MSTPLVDHLGYAKLCRVFPGFSLTYSSFVGGITIQLKLPGGVVINDSVKSNRRGNKFNRCVSLIKRNLRKHYRGENPKI